MRPTPIRRGHPSCCGLCLGLNICESHPFPCGSTVTSRETLVILQKKHRSFLSPLADERRDLAGFKTCRCSLNKTKGLLRGDWKHSDGLTLVPWQRERYLTWNATVVDTLARSYIPTTSMTQCGMAEAAALRTRAKYADIIQSHVFVPIAIETLGPINMEGQRFLDSLGERLSSVFGVPRITTFLYPENICALPNFKCGRPSRFFPCRDSDRRLTSEPVFDIVHPRIFSSEGIKD